MRCGNLPGLHSRPAAWPGMEPGNLAWMDLAFLWHLRVTIAGDTAEWASDPIWLL